jgi:2-polyprenyl-3-methyl-5-hydroxy-6-metoxy-1,4-benzoquinol methylase
MCALSTPTLVTRDTELSATVTNHAFEESVRSGLRVAGDGDDIEDVRQRRRYNWLIAQAKRLLTPGAAIIDWGCGSGIGVRMFADAGFNACGYDVDEAAVAHARSHFDVRATSDLLALPDAPNAICCSSAVEHIPSMRPLASYKDFLSQAPVLLGSHPYREPYGRNPHHSWCELDEREIPGWPRIFRSRCKFVYEPLYGVGDECNLDYFTATPSVGHNSSAPLTPGTTIDLLFALDARDGGPCMPLSVNEQKFIARVLAAVPHKATVLDCGAGRGGIYHTALLERVSKLTLLDAYAPYLKYSPWPEWVKRVVGEAPAALAQFATGSFDVVLGFDFIEHLPQELALATIAEMKRIARATVALFVPEGEHARTTDIWRMGGDKWQTHRAVWHADELLALGFAVEVWPDYHANKPDEDPGAMWAVWRSRAAANGAG